MSAFSPFRTLYIAFLVFGLMSCKDQEGVNTGTSTTTPFVFALDGKISEPPLPDDNPLSVEGVDLGRQLFYDPILSADSSQSCGSCHQQTKAFTDDGKAFSVGIQGLEGKRNTMPIFNLAWHTHGFFWDGRATLLRHQSVLPIQDPLEMDQNINDLLNTLNQSGRYLRLFKEVFEVDVIDELHLSLALEQFLMSIISIDSKFDQVMQGKASFTPEEKLGAQLFNTEFIPGDTINRGADCFHCHGNTLFMALEYMNNGLDSTLTDQGRGEITGHTREMGAFKVPSLRNIELTGPFMHDGRFNTLEEVIDFYSEGVVKDSPNMDPNMHALAEGLNLTSKEKSAFIAFLKTLTDHTYLNNKDYENPYE